MDWRRVTAASVLFAGVAAALGCGSSGAPATTPSPVGSPTITIVGQNGAQSFSPNPASFGGEQVVFKNNDSVTHRVVLNDGSVDTGDIAPGATSRAVTIPAAGINYHCSLHPTMVGSSGASSGTPPPPCQGIYC